MIPNIMMTANTICIQLESKKKCLKTILNGYQKILGLDNTIKPDKIININT